MLPEAQRMPARTASRRDRRRRRRTASPTELRDRIAHARCPPTVDVRTGERRRAEQSDDIKDNLFLHDRAARVRRIALFVGAFIIFNTFSITVAQRMREFALLRTLGARAPGDARGRSPRRS